MTISNKTAAAFVLTDAELAKASAAAAKAAQSVADASVKGDAAFTALADTLRSLSGSVESAAGTQWGSISRAFKDAYAARVAAKKGGEPNAYANAADVAWARGVKALDLTKPQTVAQRQAAEKKQAQRQADKADKGKPAADAKNPADGATPAGEPVTLSGTEYHLLRLIRAGQFAAAQTLVAELAKAPKPAAPAPAAKPAKTAKAKQPEAAPF